MSQRSTFNVQRSALMVRRCAAFTLIELLVVIVIIAILAGMIVGASKYAWTKSASSRAQGEVAAMETAMESYKNDNGVFTNTATIRNNVTINSSVLYAALAGGEKKYFTFKPNQLRVTGGVTNIIDPFGAPYNYYQSSNPTLVTNVATFDLWSYGPNGVNDEGGVDDITNWRR